jgi:hypothetical protein
MLRLGALNLVGLSLPALLRAAGRESEGASRPAAKACIFLYLEGGPAHQDLWDMKPNAPVEVRGEFNPIRTTLAGLEVCEHLPLLARQAHHLAFLRSVHHGIVDHNAGTYYAMTGRYPVVSGNLITAVDSANFPCYGSVLARWRPGDPALPGFVHVPDLMSNNGVDIAGQTAGFLGGAYEPFVAGDPSADDYQVPGLTPPEAISTGRLDRRRSLVADLDRTLASLGEHPSLERMDTFYRHAFEMISSPAARRAFRLDEEPQKLRERYGFDRLNDRSRGVREFGGLPHLGQCLLLARRLVEAGVRLVTVCTGRRYDQTWDTHRGNFDLLRKSILPMVDRAFSALLEDLAERGLLDETLVVAMGEFGRTPRVGQITSSAGADSAGRDHWPYCYSVMLGGAGVEAGTIYGASDSQAAYPASNPVTPEDVAATIYHLMGVDPETRIDDRLDRPQTLALGTPIAGVLRR